MIAEIVFNLPIGHPFDYLVPDEWRGRLQPGMRVLAPFGHRRMIGYVANLRAKSRVAEPKTLLQLIDPHPVLSREALRLARWLADYYCCGLGQACASFAPTALRLRALNTDPPEASRQEFQPGPPPELTSQQRQAYASLEHALRSRRHQTFLLHGITGSGKTELYLRTIALAREQGRSAIVLVPEIALTPQTIDRFRERFGPAVMLWHSRLTARQRSLHWQQLLEGNSRIVVGTRSAVFAPVHRAGVIILDEEHDPSYKQDQTPRYHAREVAMARARVAGAVVILGSATPSLESYHAAQAGRFHLLKLTERIKGRPLPKVDVIDMRQEMSGRRRSGGLSDRLRLALQRVVDLNEQAILLLNRRGFARVAQCPVCGAALRCSQCAVVLVYHAGTKQLICHYCHLRQPLPDTCPLCHRGYLRLRGVGTERIESELHRLFPLSTIARMDSDSTTASASHRRLYDAVKTQQISLLVGTQMVAKGLDLPQVTLVGVVSADTALNLPDFRAGERTFDLLTQVAGRAGRGEKPGQVLIQTHCPRHDAILAASRHDYEAFYRAEIRMRKRSKLPPFTHLVELTLQGRRQEEVERAAHTLKNALDARRGAGVVVLGPAPHRLARLRRTFRWRLVLKARAVSSLGKLVRSALREGWRFQGLPVTVDVDPL